MNRINRNLEDQQSITAISKCLSRQARSRRQALHEIALTDAMLGILKELAGDADFAALLESACRFVPTLSQPLYSRLIKHSSDTRLFLNGINRSSPIPVHDHPATTAMQLVLYGDIRITHYRDTFKAHSRITRLHRSSQRELTPGDHDFIDHANNIHGVEALTQHAVMLNLQRVSNPAQGHKHWFLPTFANEADGQFWHRIRGRQFSSRGECNDG
jgi:hypothetical protein